MKSGPFIRAGVMVTLLFLGVSGAFGQKIRGVAFTRSVDLPEDYIQIKTLGKADAIMMTPPRVHHMTRKADNVSVEMFSPLDLWRVPQRLGHWASPGVSFRMARVVTAPPDVEGNKRNLIHLREDCDKMLAALGAVDFDQPQALAAWAAAFTDAEPSGEFRSLPDTIKLHRIRLGALTRSDAVIITAFFSVKPGMHGADPDRMYAAFLELEEGTPVADAQALLEKSFLPSVATLSGAPVRSSPGSASRRGTAGPATRVESPERIRSREVVLQTIRGLPRWWVSESDRYIIVSDLSGNSKSFVERLNGNLNELLKVYESIIPPVKPIEAVSAVRVFAESTDYLQYVGPGYEWSGGMWNPSRVELIIRVSGWQQGSERKASLAGTIQHEALHQYLFYAFPGIQTAAWYNEGHAQFMEGIELTARGARLGELRLEAEELQGMLDGKRVDLRKISRISYKDFYDGGGSDRGRSDNYTLAWAFVYYLRKGAGSDANSPFARIIPRYEAAIRAGQSGEDATPLAFEGIDFDALTEDFIAFWTSSSRRSAAQRMEIAALCPTP